MEDKISEVENELLEASEEMRKVTVGRRKTEAEDEAEGDALTAWPPGMRSSVKQHQDSYCATSHIKHQAVRLGPEDST